MHAIESAFSMIDSDAPQRELFSKNLKLHPNNEIYFYRTGFPEENKIRLFDLSSGEKQFYIMLAEALLCRDQQSILLIDEPELSLHISWQSRLVHDLKIINPDVQLILATHSPDMVSTSQHKLIRMEEAVTGPHGK